MPSAAEADAIIARAAANAKPDGPGKLVYALGGGRGSVKFDPNDPELFAKYERWREQRREAHERADKAARDGAQAAQVAKCLRESGIDPKHGAASIELARMCCKPGAGKMPNPDNWNDQHVATYLHTVAELDRVSREGGILALIGRRGRGKSWLMTAAVKQAAQDGKPAWYRRALDFFYDLRSTFKTASTRNETQVVNDWVRPWLITLDELQVRADTPFEDVVLTDLVDRRYAAGKATILAANLTFSEFETRAGESILSRLNETGGIIVCDWPNFRE